MTSKSDMGCLILLTKWWPSSPSIMLICFIELNAFIYLQHVLFGIRWPFAASVLVGEKQSGTIGEVIS